MEEVAQRIQLVEISPSFHIEIQIFERTMDIFHNSNNWIQKENNFTQRDIDEAKLNVFKALDQPVLPSARGQRLFLCGITDEQFENHRNMLRNVSIEDVKRA